MYVNTSSSPKSTHIYCTNKCRHDFVWERPDYVAEIIWSYMETTEDFI